MESSLIVKIDGDQAEQASIRLSRALSGLEQQGNEAAEGVARVGSDSDKTTSKLDRLKGGISLAGKALIGLGTAAGALGVATRWITGMTDSVAGYRGQLRLVAGDQGNVNSLLDEALQLSNDTGQALGSTISLYSRMARASGELGLNQDELLTITKAVNQSFVVSGASAQEAGSATLQLSQGLASGTLRGEELNSVMENSPRLARALAEGLNVPIGRLREMGSEGELSADAVTSALLKSASTIEEEFAQMPLTVGRSLQVLRNNLQVAFTEVDTEELTGAIGDFSEMLQDPDFIRALADLAQGVLTLTSEIAKLAAGAISGARAVAEFFGELSSGLGGGQQVSSVLKQYNDLFDKIDGTTETRRNQSSLRALKNDLAELATQLTINGEELREVNGEWVLYNRATETTLRQSGEIVENKRELNAELKTESELQESTERAMRSAARRREALNVLWESAHDTLDEMNSSNVQLIDSLEDQISLLGMAEREQFILTETRKLDADATKEQIARVQELAGSLFDSKEEIRANEEAMKAAAQQSDAWSDAMVHAVERIDTAFSDGWTDLFTDLFEGTSNAWDNFLDTMKGGFLRTLAEMAHAAITKPIVVGITGAMGLGGSGAASAASGAGGVSSLLSAGGGISNAFGLFGALGNMYGAAGGLLQHAGFNGAANSAFNVGAGYQAGGWNAAGQLGLNIGAGLVGGYAGTQLGESLTGRQAGSAWGATAGGLVGSVFGPVGTLAGSALGGVVDSIFGRSTTVDNRGARGILDLGSGVLDTRGRSPDDPKFSQENFDAVQLASALFQEFSSSIGGSSGEFNIAVGDRRGVRLNGDRFDDWDSMIAEGLNRILDAATDLDPLMGRLVTSFVGLNRPVQETIEFATSLASLMENLGLDVVAMAFEDFDAAAQRASLTMQDSFTLQLEKVVNLSNEFDGSAASLTTLNSEFVSLQQQAYAMATAIASAGVAIDQATQSNITYFQTQVMNEEELQQFRQQRRAELRDVVSDSLDPTEIQNALLEYQRLAREMFDALSPEEQRAEGISELYQLDAENIRKSAQDQLDVAKETLESAMATATETLNTMLNNQADAMETAAAQIRAAANDFRAAAGTPQEFVVRFDAGSELT